MQFESHPWMKSTFFLTALALCTASLVGCGKQIDPSMIGTFRMGEKVQVGALTYTILEAEWKTALVEGGGGPTPQNRYMLVRISVTNGGGTVAAIPSFQLQGANRAIYTELTQGLQDLPNWLGVLRSVSPAQTEQGYVVFDAPLGAYKLAISDGGEVGSEKFAYVDMPVQLE
ncbi:MAG: DUF4352 domain-containing protein [Bryobacteraceae bacterium]|nr:DUF4352 domain-containing protein [Bryobacteraceae bacterium]